jgi:hypothetical protein
MSSAKSSAQQQRQLVLLGGLGVVLALVIGYQFWPSDPGVVPRPSSAATRSAAPPRASTRGRSPEMEAIAAQAASGEVEPVHLERLTAKVPDQEDGRRNPFSLAAEAPPPSEKPEGAGTVATGPPPPPPVAPISLKFIGTVTVPSKVGRIAAFSDGKFVYYGREGEVIEGRYRIVKIGEESVQMEYADGRGRQTIRLSGK